MKNFAHFCIIVVYIIFAALFIPGSAFSAEQFNLVSARGIYSEVNSLISSGRPRTATFDAPWFSAPHAAVRKTVVKFYFTEKNQQDKNNFQETLFTLRKAIATHQFGNVKPMETDEYYSSSRGNLVFYYSLADVTEEALNTHYEFRYYYGNDGKLARAINSQRPINVDNSKTTYEQRDSNLRMRWKPFLTMS